MNNLFIVLKHISDMDPNQVMTPFSIKVNKEVLTREVKSLGNNHKEIK